MDMSDRMKTIIFEKNKDVCKIILNRPESLNAISTEMLQEIDKTVDEINLDKGVRAVIVTGSGKAFCAGADVKELAAKTSADAAKFSEYGKKVFSKIEDSKKMFVAAINGYALGGGNELAMACDIRIASELAKFGQPEINLGIMPGFGATLRLPLLVGMAKAKELMTLGKLIDAQEAERIGLVNKVVKHENLLEEVGKICEEIAKKSGLAIELLKKTVKNPQSETKNFSTCFSSEETKKYIESFLKR